MYQTVDASKVDKYSVRSDILDDTLEYLSFFEARDNLFALFFEFFLDKSFVRYYYVFVFVVYFYDLEFHSLIDKYVVVAYRLHIDLRTGQESLYSKYFYYHTTFCTGFDIAVNDFLTFESGFHSIPRTSVSGKSVRQNELTFLVFLIFDKNFYLITYLKVGIVAELGVWYYTIGFVADIYYYFTFVDRHYGTLYNLLVLNLA